MQDASQQSYFILCSLLNRFAFKQTSLRKGFEIWNTTTVKPLAIYNKRIPTIIPEVYQSLSKQNITAVKIDGLIALVRAILNVRQRRY